MAIAFVGSTASTTTPTGGTPTFTLSLTAGSTFMVAGIQISDAGGNDASGVTWNGVAMTKVGISRAPQGNMRISLWYLSSPATGSNSLVVTVPGGASLECVATIAGYSGVSATGQPDSTNGATMASVSVGVSTTVVATGCWLIGVVAQRAVSLVTTGSARSGTTGNVTTLIDSNGTVGTGSQSLTATMVLDNNGIVLASFAPAAAVSTGLPDARVFFI